MVQCLRPSRRRVAGHRPSSTCPTKLKSTVEQPSAAGPATGVATLICRSTPSRGWPLGRRCRSSCCHGSFTAAPTAGSRARTSGRRRCCDAGLPLPSDGLRPPPRLQLRPRDPHTGAWPPLRAPRHQARRSWAILAVFLVQPLRRPHGEALLAPAHDPALGDAVCNHAWPRARAADGAVMRVLGHSRGHQCPRCRQNTYCDDCGICESCHFAAPNVDLPHPPAPEPKLRCKECDETPVHARSCSATLRAAGS